MKKIIEEKRTREDLQRLILDVISTAGMLAVGLIAPNVLQAMHKVGFLPVARQAEYISSSATRLRKRGLVEFKNGYYQLTKEGKKKLRKWHISDYKLEKPKRWDRRWRMFVFDIPEKKKKVRRQVSMLFTQAGFYRLQDSVWVYPYDCEEMIGLLKTDLGVGKDLLYVIADEIENDRHLRETFDLFS